MKELWALFAVFFKIGLFTFGGGPAMLPVIKREAVDVRKWMSEEEIVDCIAICQSLPGVFAINSCIFIGNKVKGIPGALVAAFATAFPAFAAIIIILLFLGQVEDNSYVLGAFEGVKAASVALILITVFRMGKGILTSIFAYAVAFLSFLIIVIFGINAVWAILLGAAAGYLAYLIRRLRQKEADEK